MEETPWSLGFDARARDVPISANPFDNEIQGTPESAARWRAGWIDLDRHMSMKAEACDAAGLFAPPPTFKR